MEPTRKIAPDGVRNGGCQRWQRSCWTEGHLSSHTHKRIASWKIEMLKHARHMPQELLYAVQISRAYELSTSSCAEQDPCCPPGLEQIRIPIVHSIQEDIQSGRSHGHCDLWSNT